MNRLAKVPFHPLLLALYPVLALFSFNIHEVSTNVLWRPLLISLAGSLVLLVLLRLALRDWLRAALVTSLFLAGFFTYGRIYEFLKTTPLAGLGIIRHRYLLVAGLLLLVIASVLLLRRIRNFKPLTAALNLVAIILVALPAIQIAGYALNASQGQKAASGWTPSTSLVNPVQPESKPDVYYIILDTYARSDRIKAELGYDNSAFLQELEGMGFYIANCSRSNYNNTHNSIVSSLNMEYLPALYAEGAARGISIPDIWLLIDPSAVRLNFEALGYRSVAFDTGFEWTRVRNADLYLERGTTGYGVTLISPFEQMLLDSTALKAITDQQEKSALDRYLYGTHPQANFIGQEEFILDQLPKIAEIGDPTFTFAHVDIPHPPYVFSPDGYLEDPGYWSVPVKGAVDEAHFKAGYIYALEYIDARMLEIVREILARSSTPPIIIIQGDHGFGEGINFPILNAYYLPGAPTGLLYPTISPVNSFRVVFNQYFGGQYPLLPDESYQMIDITQPVPESLPDCLSK